MCCVEPTEIIMENFEREKSQSATIGTAERKLWFIAQKSAPIVNAWLPPASSNNSKELIKMDKMIKILPTAKFSDLHDSIS